MTFPPHHPHCQSSVVDLTHDDDIHNDDDTVENNNDNDNDNDVDVDVNNNKDYNRIDYYSVLNVNPSATDSEIRTAYLKLARLYHTDKLTAIKDINKIRQGTGSTGTR